MVASTSGTYPCKCLSNYPISASLAVSLRPSDPTFLVSESFGDAAQHAQPLGTLTPGVLPRAIFNLQGQRILRFFPLLNHIPSLLRFLCLFEARTILYYTATW